MKNEVKGPLEQVPCVGKCLSTTNEPTPEAPSLLQRPWVVAVAMLAPLLIAILVLSVLPLRRHAGSP